jgi:hypothetical protein
MGAFLSGLFSAVGPRLEEKHQQELALQNQKKQGEYSTYWNSMQVAATKLSELKGKQNLTPKEEQEAQRLAAQYAWSGQQLTKLTKGSKPLGEAVQKVGGFVKQLLSHPSPKGALKPPQDPGAHGKELAADAKNEFPSPLKQRGPLQPPASSAGGDPSMQGAMALAAQGTPEAMKARQAEVDRKRRWTEAEQQDVHGKDALEFSEVGKFPPRETQATRKQVQFKLPDGKVVDAQYDPKAGVYYDNKNEPYEIPEGAQLMSKPPSARPTIIASDFITLEDAKKLHEQGMPFTGGDGKEIDVAAIPAGMVLQKVHIPGQGTIYEPRNINDKVVTVGNMRYAVNPAEVQKLSQGAGTELGVANPGSSATHQQITVDPKGNTNFTDLSSARKPAVTGVEGRGAGQPNQAQPSAAKPSAPQAPQDAAKPPNPPAAPQASAKQPVGPPPKPPGIPVGMYNRSLERITPVRESVTQLFGDSKRQLKGLMDFSGMADNPESRRKLGKALNLTFDAIGKATGDSHINAGAGPIHLSAGGGVIELIENAFGVKPALAQQTAQIMQKAISDLSPDEREAYDATMSAFGTIVGLRSLTKASAAQASVATIEREMPVIGVNTVSSNQFLDQMERLAEIVHNGTKGIPSGMWDPEELDRINSLPQTIKALKQQKGGSPKGKLNPPGKTVKMRAPDGSEQFVSADQVEHYKSKGAKVVQ